MKLTFSISGAPRTKKTSSQVVHIPGKRTESFGKCSQCGQEVGRERGFTKVLPSSAFQEWLDAACLQGPSIRFELQKAGAVLPLTGPVAIRALFFRQTDVGDILGFAQALADGLQAPMYAFTCSECNGKKTLSADHRGVKCSICRKALHIGKQNRQGLGIILDDSQIQSFDGSRLLKDSARPRIEVTIEEFTEQPIQKSMFEVTPEPMFDIPSVPFVDTKVAKRKPSAVVFPASTGLVSCIVSIWASIRRPGSQRVPHHGQAGNMADSPSGSSETPESPSVMAENGRRRQRKDERSDQVFRHCVLVSVIASLPDAGLMCWPREYCRSPVVLTSLARAGRGITA